MLIGLNPGQALGDHQVHENAWLVVVDGQVEVGSGEETVEAGAGTLFRSTRTSATGWQAERGADPAAARTWPGAEHYRGSAS